MVGTDDNQRINTDASRKCATNRLPHRTVGFAVAPVALTPPPPWLQPPRRPLGDGRVLGDTGRHPRQHLVPDAVQPPHAGHCERHCRRDVRLHCHGIRYGLAFSSRICSLASTTVSLSRPREYGGMSGDAFTSSTCSPVLPFQHCLTGARASAVATLPTIPCSDIRQWTSRSRVASQMHLICESPPVRSAISSRSSRGGGADQIDDAGLYLQPLDEFGGLLEE